MPEVDEGIERADFLYRIFEAGSLWNCVVFHTRSSCSFRAFDPANDETKRGAEGSGDAMKDFVPLNKGTSS